MGKVERIRQFEELYHSGIKPTEIAKKMGVNVRTAQRYAKELNINDLSGKAKFKNIDFEEYYSAVLAGYADKVELSETLGVSNKTLIEYEKQGALLRAAERLWFAGFTEDEIKNILHARKGVDDLVKLLRRLPKLDTVLHYLKVASNFMEKYAENDTSAVNHYEAIESAITKVQMLKRIERKKQIFVNKSAFIDM